MTCLEKTAKSVDEAIKLALEELKVSQEKVKVEVLEQPNKGIFGIIGSKLAKVKVSVIEDEIDIARKFLRDVLNSMDILAEIRIKKEDSTLYIDLTGPKMGIIIGRRGQTLDSLQYLLSLVVNKKNDKEEFIRVVLDTEDYRKKREETLIRLANKIAGDVIRYKKRVQLEPMNPYERRIIHSTLQQYPQIVTYSEGEDPNRRVIITLK